MTENENARVRSSRRNSKRVSLKKMRRVRPKVWEEAAGSVMAAVDIGNSFGAV